MAAGGVPGSGRAVGDCNPVSASLTRAVLAKAAAARQSRNQVAAAMAQTYSRVRYWESVCGAKLWRERRIPVRPELARPTVSAICPGCGCRWVPATPETRCSLCTARR